MGIRNIYYSFVTIALIVLLITVIKDEHNVEKLEVIIKKELTKELNLDNKKIDLYVVKEKQIYKTLINGKGYEVFVDKDVNVKNIIELGKDIKGDGNE